MTALLPAFAHEHGFRDALGRLLESLGQEVQAPSENATRDLNFDMVARSLGEHGYPSRIVRVRTCDLRTLPLPTIALSADGAPLLLLARSGQKLVVETREQGQRVLDAKDLEREWGGIAIERQVHRAQATKLRGILRTYLLSHRRELGLITIWALIGAGVAPLPAWITRTVMDAALPQGAAQLLTALTLALVLIAAQQAWLSLLRSAVLRRTDLLLSRATLTTMFRQLTEGNYHGLSQKPLGNLLQALSSSEAAALTTSSLVSGVVFDTASALCAVSILLMTAPRVAAGLILLLAPATALAIWLAHRSALTQEREVSASGAQRAALYELLAGVATVKALGAERPLVGGWLKRLLDERVLVLERGRLGLLRDVVLELAQRGSAVLAFGVAGYACSNGELSVGAFIMVTSMADALARAARTLARFADPVLQIRALARRVDEESSSCAPTARESERRWSDEGDPDAIVLRDVWFRYGPNEPWILRGYSLRIARGEHFHLTGTSGTGKTTLLRLIAGLYEPERGSVSVFGKKPTAARSNLVYLPQQAYLFEGSILHNLEVLSGGSREGIARAAEQTGLAAWLATLPMGFDTVLPPGAPNISGGEKQWIVLTAAVAASRDVVLLDEATSQIDRFLRQRLNLEEMFAGRTLVHVAHDE